MGAKLADQRAAAYAAYNEAVDAFEKRDFPAAQLQFAAAIDSRMLNPDVKASAVAKRSLCRAVAGQLTEALADLDQLGPVVADNEEVLVARSFVLKKQGKTAESRAALAKAKRLNPNVAEFKG
jgi:hypothetical protein